MTTTQRIKTQKELELLRHRKAKADSLGPQVIASQQQLYDTICARILKLQDDLAIDDGGIAADILSSVRELLNMEWWPGLMQVMLTTDEDLRKQLEQAERDLIASYNQSQGSRCRAAISDYMAAMQQINDAAAALIRAEGQITMKGWEEFDGKTPFED